MALKRTTKVSSADVSASQHLTSPTSSKSLTSGPTRRMSRMICRSVLLPMVPHVGADTMPGLAPCPPARCINGNLTVERATDASMSERDGDSCAAPVSEFTPDQMKEWMIIEFSKRYIIADKQMQPIPKSSSFLEELYQMRPGYSSIIDEFVACIERKFIFMLDSQDVYAAAFAQAANLTWTGAGNQDENKAFIIAALASKFSDRPRDVFDVVSIEVCDEYSRICDECREAARQREKERQQEEAHRQEKDRRLQEAQEENFRREEARKQQQARFEEALKEALHRCENLGQTGQASTCQRHHACHEQSTQLEKPRVLERVAQQETRQEQYLPGTQNLEIIAQGEVVIKQEITSHGDMARGNGKAAKAPTAEKNVVSQKQWAPKPWVTFRPGLTDEDFDRSTREGLEAWAQWTYCNSFLPLPGGQFIGFGKLKTRLVDPNKDRSGYVIQEIINKLRYQPYHKYSFPLIDQTGAPMLKEINHARKNETSSTLTSTVGHSSTQAGPLTQRGHITQNVSFAHTDASTTAETLSKSKPPTDAAVPLSTGANISNGPLPGTFSTHEPTSTIAERKHDLLARQISQMELNDHHRSQNREPRHTESSDHVICEPSNANPEEGEFTSSPDFEAMDLLMTNDGSENGEEVSHARARHAPLVVEDIIRSKTTNKFVPQYGLMGTHDQNAGDVKSKLFLNTNVPFSAFVCGVQGSGKSHTTSCILENCLIQSKNLGELKMPLSALVFSYGSWTGDGSGFNISEAAFLGAPNLSVGEKHVKKINVLVCETNYLRIQKKYERLPNVTVSCFKLDPKCVGIDLMLTLMNVNESAQVPLYMSRVLTILRDMATRYQAFDYNIFKESLKTVRFDPTQQNMLDIRLATLESFLDLDGKWKQHSLFKPGEITIMDMSCPFVDANTACIMFKCGLQQYLQSDASGKLIVLDEAHKYMLDVPGAKDLNEELKTTIRLQRHTGTRVIISTQEPTLLADLIALCSVSVLHRFSSPEWFSAIKKHIRIPDQEREALMERIESLPTGTAIVYSPNAVLGYDNGQLRMGSGTMVRVKMRRRITADGGQTILAV